MNLYTLHNGTLTVTLDACGAVLHSIVKDGAEYLWQGDAKYWARRDANLFPYVGRLTDGQYLLDGKTYPMTIHGFCIGTDFAVTEQTESSIRFTLRSNEKTLSMYPFHFAFHVCYTLRGNQIRKTCLVENRIPGRCTSASAGTWFQTFPERRRFFSMTELTLPSLASPCGWIWTPPITGLPAPNLPIL